MTATGMACGSCGAELRAGDKFCHECARPVVAAANPAEYKQVTVLFADVVHSMDIAAAVGAERLREIMAELVNRCAAVVQRYSGTVDKFTGDGIMAVFGAPVAMEDHAVSEYHDTMLDHDDLVGDLLGLLDELGIADNTIVMYSTDNGPHMNSSSGSHTPSSPNATVTGSPTSAAISSEQSSCSCDGATSIWRIRAGPRSSCAMTPAARSPTPASPAPTAAKRSPRAT
jgi:hypothetical protein